jgi:hypothetical protein
MTATLDDVTKKKAKAGPSAQEQVAEELVRRVREQGLSLTGRRGGARRAGQRGAFAGPPFAGERAEQFAGRADGIDRVALARPALPRCRLASISDTCRPWLAR